MTAARKTTRKKTASKKAPRKSALQLIEESLPKDLRSFAKRMQRNLSRIEKQIETAQKENRRRFARILKDASHRLGQLEAEGEKRFLQQTTQARKEIAKLLHRIELAIAPRPKKGTARKKAAAKKPTAPA